MVRSLKFVLDDAAVYRQPEVAKAAAAVPMTALERRGAEAASKMFQLMEMFGFWRTVRASP